MTTMPHPFIIRQATEADLPAICAVDEEAFAPYGTAEEPSVFAARLAVFPAGFIVLEAPVGDAPTILGYGCSEKWESEREPALGEDPAQTHHPDGRIFCITGMAVRRAHWRLGYGTALLERLLAIAHEQGCEAVMLETTHAVGLYARHGFVVTGQRTQGDVTLTVMARVVA